MLKANGELTEESLYPNTLNRIGHKRHFKNALIHNNLSRPKNDCLHQPALSPKHLDKVPAEGKNSVYKLLKKNLNNYSLYTGLYKLLNNRNNNDVLFQDSS